jgi:hypothetical protein
MRSTLSNAFLSRSRSDICKLVKLDSFLLCAAPLRSRPNALELSCSPKNGLCVIMRSAIKESTRGDALKPAVEAAGAEEAEAPYRDLAGELLPPGDLAGELLPPGALAGDLIAATARIMSFRAFDEVCETVKRK